MTTCEVAVTTSRLNVGKITRVSVRFHLKEQCSVHTQLLTTERQKLTERDRNSQKETENTYIETKRTI